MIIQEENYLAHYGILRKSGRYPWGSGADAQQRSRDFLGMVDDMKKQGLDDATIMKGFGMNTTDFRAAKSIARNQAKQADINRAQRLKDKGYSNVAIGKQMGINESSVRSLLAPGAKDNADVLATTSSMIRDQIDKKSYVDVGGGVENQLGISDTRLKTAIAMLKEEGYKMHYVKVQQLGTGKFTTLKVMSKPDVPYSEVFKNRDKIQPFTDYSPDGGHTGFSIQPPINISSKRIGINYAEDGGGKADGVIYVRPGVEDVSLGKAHYAQVRIAVDGTHYLKGMAMYKDDLPNGVDLQFNTNKSNTGHKLDAMKPQKEDETNPFGAVIRQLPKLDRDGKEIRNTVRSAMNIVNEEGDWDKWSKNLSSQFLSKQSPVLAKGQLAMALEKRKTQFEEISKLTNPAVRKKLLDTFADDADSAAVHLKAAALPRQRTQVILPINTLKDNEVFAPNFRNGERVALVRHPHGGTFEIPELTVNNNHPDAIRIIGKHAKDAIGINAKVAERLSGADFDGDQVLVIPNNSGKVKSSASLEGLHGFNPQRDYKLPDHVPGISDSAKQHKMGDISNLITDMTIKHANRTELAAAVRHSMVVIDAEKHHLDVKSSYVDNNIAHLKQKYQAKPDGRAGGASTLVSRAGSEIRVAERKQGFRVDPITGRKIYIETGATRTDAKGRVIAVTEKSSKLAETHDAHSLSSGTPIEKIYADYSNQVKDLANQARLRSVATKPIPQSDSAKRIYAKEVARLNGALNVAEGNRPRERQAQVVANAIVRAKRESTPDMDNDTLKKVKSQALTEARIRVGAQKEQIEISDREWEAIQAGAVSNTKLKRILNNADIEKVKVRATPRESPVMTSNKMARAQAMINSGYSQSEIADALGVNLSTLKSSLSKGEG